MLNTYHVNVELNARAGRLPQWFSAVVIAEHDHPDEATEEVRDFFDRHNIGCRVLHTWEVSA